MEEKKYLRRREVAQLLGVAGQTVDRYRLKGVLQATQLIENGLMRYDVDSVKEFMKGRHGR